MQSLRRELTTLLHIKIAALIGFVLRDTDIVHVIVLCSGADIHTDTFHVES